jgi:O-acetyl-ADP-ribose deacetylase (regulator of RNase III)
MRPTLHLVDLSRGMVDAWRVAFQAHPEVKIIEANVLDVARGAVVSPANSYGDMGGGVDLAYRLYFGREIERRVQARIGECFGNFLPIGEAVIVETGKDTITHLISAPTMFLPEPTTEENVFLAMSAALKMARLHGSLFQDIFCPGMGTGVGQLPPKHAAQAMQRAFQCQIAA